MTKAMTQKKTDKLFDTITSNGCREMTKTRFHQAINEAVEELEQEVYSTKIDYVALVKDLINGLKIDLERYKKLVK